MKTKRNACVSIVHFSCCIHCFSCFYCHCFVPLLLPSTYTTLYKHWFSAMTFIDVDWMLEYWLNAVCSMDWYCLFNLTAFLVTLYITIYSQYINSWSRRWVSHDSGPYTIYVLLKSACASAQIVTIFICHFLDSPEFRSCLYMYLLKRKTYLPCTDAQADLNFPCLQMPYVTV